MTSESGGTPVTVFPPQCQDLLLSLTMSQDVQIELDSQEFDNIPCPHSPVMLAQQCEEDPGVPVNHRMTSQGIFQTVFTPLETRLISSALHVDPRLCESELLCFALNKKISRGEKTVCRRDVAEAWQCIPNSFKLTARNHHAGSLQLNEVQRNPKVIYFGVSPRNNSCALNGTWNHPQLRQTVLSFIKQNCPDFRFTTSALREGFCLGPHRDPRNAPCGTLFQVLSEVDGGGLWLADAQGDVLMPHEGNQVKGRIYEAKETPLIFDARTHLHASSEWQGGQRLVLVAWSVSHAFSLASDLRLQLEQWGFPLPRPDDLSYPNPCQVSSPSKKKLRLANVWDALRSENRDKSGLILQGNVVVHRVEDERPNA